MTTYDPHDSQESAKKMDFAMCRIQEGAYDNASLGVAELLGSSGHMTAAVQLVMREIEEVHQSDTLMQYEACFPYPELTQVSVFPSLRSRNLCQCMRCRLLNMTWENAFKKCSQPITMKKERKTQQYKSR